jgi:ribosome biogenesis GTPase / thiamine phosphate phosphatase
MELADLGFDVWFQQERTEPVRPECGVARITRVDRDRYLVRNEEKELPAETVGRLLFATDSSKDLPCVGDWVSVQYCNDGASALIHDLYPRRSFLRRKTAGIKIDYQMIASNVDAALIIQSCDHAYNLRRMERYLVMAQEGNVEPILLLSKSDLVDRGTIEKFITEIDQAHVGVRAVAFSNQTAGGIDAVRQLLVKGKTYCLLGASGVGKTTLLNQLLGRDAFDTNPVREKDGRGRHTTSSRQLSVLNTGALLIDTPGMRELGLLADAEAIEDSFADIIELAAECRFNDCTHTVEAGCAILKAVQQKDINEARYNGYIKLMKEAAFHQMSYVERRRKDKKFGRMVKEVTSHSRKKPSSE